MQRLEGFFRPLPTITRPDWASVALTAEIEGECLIADNSLIEANAAHASLHRRGMGIYKLPGGWRVAPLGVHRKRHQPKGEPT